MKYFLWVSLVIAVALASCEGKLNTEEKSSEGIPDRHHVNSIDSLAEPAPDLKLDTIFMETGLLNIQSLSSDILVELKYSTPDNFMHEDVYGDLEKCFLQKEAADKLVKAQNLLSEKKPGYKLLCYDCARPRSVQRIMWDIVKMPNKKDYVAPPAEGSIHNYGCAVDLTIADENGAPLDMGTPYDYFGPEARPDKESELLRSGKLTPEQHANRLLLRNVMHKAGFSVIPTEWWHFNAGANERIKATYKIIE